MRDVRLIFVGLFVLVGAHPGAATAQSGLPGGRGTSTRQHAEAFNYEMNVEINRFLEGWQAAWHQRNADVLLDHYTENAMVVFPDGEPVQGIDAITQFFAERLASIGAIRLTQIDFQASGRMAYLAGWFSYLHRDANGFVEQVTGLHVTVFQQRGRDWKIRSQMLRADGPAH